MKRLSTYLWRAVLAALALFLIALVSAPFILGRLFPPAKIRALVAQQAKQNLGRDVKIGGVGWSLIHGVTITDFAISERPDFSAGTFAAFDSLSVRVKLWPLLHRRLVVASLEAKNPQVSVVQHKDGTFNFSDMLSSPAQKSAAPAAPAAAPSESFSYVAGKIEISGGHVIYRDEAAGREVEVSNLDADIRHFRIAGPVDASVSAAFAVKQGEQAHNGTFSYDGTVDLGGGDPARMDFKFRKMAAAFAGWSARLSGGVKSLQSPAFDVKADVSRGGTDLASGRVSGDAALTRTYGLKSVQASLDLKTPGFKASDAGLTGAAAGLTVPPLSLTGQASFAGGRLSLKGVSVASAQLGSVNVDGSLAGFGAREWNPDLALSAHLNVPQLAASQIPFLPASVPASLVFPQAVLDLKAAVSGAQAKISTLDVKTDYGVVSVAGTVGNIWRAPAPNLSVSAKLDIPKLRADELPFLDAPADFVLPASKWNASLQADMSRIDVHALRAVVGDNDLQVSGTVSNWKKADRSVNAMLTCRRFVLGEITPLVPALAPLNLTGSGFFVLAARGPLLKPFLAGKMKFAGLGGDVSGLKFAGFGGIATFDAQRIDVPNLDGSFGSGDLQANLTVLNYATNHPAVDVQAELNTLDLGQLQAALASASASEHKTAAPSAPAKPAARSSFFANAKGQMTIGRLIHPNIKADDVRLYWNLTGIGSDLSKLNGWARLKVSGGRFDGLGDAAEKSKVVKVLVFPFLIFQKIGSLGGIRLFPNFDHIAFSGLDGDYAFNNGVMTVKDSRFSSEVADLDAHGTIDLVAQKLDLSMNTQLASLAPFPIDVTGTFDKPKIHAQLAQLLVQPAKQLIQGLFGR